MTTSSYMTRHTLLRLSAVGVVVLFASGETPRFGAPSGQARLVSIQQLASDSEACTWETASPADSLPGRPPSTLLDVLDHTSVAAAVQEGSPTSRLTAPPIRRIRDNYPIYSSVAV